ncbi:MAG: coenzyme F420-0:L-glutamate ligase [Chloroflexi bacterium]|nr:coenzyme F420-0:L-glutamate ligase [Chloroflexota bacterium]
MNSSGEIRIAPLRGIPEVTPGQDLPAFLTTAIRDAGLGCQSGDVLVVTQKIVSKAEGRVVVLASVEPSPFAVELGAQVGKDPRQLEVILRETRRIVRMDRGVMICETHHGFVCANAGVDLSNAGGAGLAALLPRDPDASCATIRAGLKAHLGVAPAVIISDTWGRPWRDGIVNVAIGVAGMRPLLRYAGQRDPHGYELHASVVAVADELAAAAELAMGKLLGIPAVLIRGYRYPRGRGSARALLRSPRRDLFR